MPIIKNILRKGTAKFQGLGNFDVFVDVRNDNNQYFNISDFPEELTLGNSSFLIAGSNLLKKNVKLKMEILDSGGNPIFISPIDNYIEGTSRRITIEAYRDTNPGPATLTILGELDPTKTNVPTSYRNTYNVRYTKDFFINTTKLNNRPILFYDQPTITATEKLIGHQIPVQSEENLTETVTGTITIDVDVSYEEQVPSSTGDGPPLV